MAETVIRFSFLPVCNKDLGLVYPPPLRHVLRGVLFF